MPRLDLRFQMMQMLPLLTDRSKTERGRFSLVQGSRGGRKIRGAVVDIAAQHEESMSCRQYACESGCTCSGHRREQARASYGSTAFPPANSQFQCTCSPSRISDGFYELNASHRRAANLDSQRPGPLFPLASQHAGSSPSPHPCRRPRVLLF